MLNKLVSIVVPVRDKPQFMASFDSILGQDMGEKFECVVVDWGSKRQNVESDIRSLLKKKPKVTCGVRLLRLPGVPTFSRGRSCNLGLKNSVGTHVMICDSDLILPPNYISSLYNLSSSEVFLRLIGKESSTGRYRKFCGHGIIFSVLESFYAVGGYDESMEGWGEEDMDMSRRLCRAGYTRIDVRVPFWTHLSHGDDQRGQAQVFCRGPRKNKVILAENDRRFLIQANVGRDWGSPKGVIRKEIR